MKWAIFVFTIGLILPALGATEKTQKQEDRVPLTLPDFSHLEQAADSQRVKISATCKTPEGRELKSNEAGFESCMLRSQNTYHRDGSKDTAAGDAQSSQNIEFKLGD